MKPLNSRVVSESLESYAILGMENELAS